MSSHVVDSAISRSQRLPAARVNENKIFGSNCLNKWRSPPVKSRNLRASYVEEIYYATFPLVGLESLEGALVFSGRELPTFMAQHCAIIVERPSEGRCVVYDFLPEAPTAAATAASLLSGRSVKGTVRQRAMRRVPPRRCTWIGTSAVQNAMKKAEDFNSRWNKELSLNKNDCRNHSAQLAKLLLDDPAWEIDSMQQQ